MFSLVCNHLKQLTVVFLSPQNEPLMSIEGAGPLPQGRPFLHCNVSTVTQNGRTKHQAP